MDSSLIWLMFIPSSIAISLSLVALLTLVSRPRPPQQRHGTTSTPKEQFDSWPGGRTKITFEGENMVRTRVKTDPVSGITFQVREVA